VVLLLVSLLLAAVLAYEAIDSARSQRATAEGVLRDYAAFAAEEYTARVARELEYYGVYPILQLLTAMNIGEGRVRLPEPASLGATATPAVQQSLGLVRYLFRSDLQAGTTAVAGDTAAVAPPWLHEALASHARTVYEPDWSSASLLEWRDGVPRLFVYTLHPLPSTSPHVAYGFEADLIELEQYFKAALERAPILPTSLTGRVPFDSVVSVRIASGSGDVLFRFPPGSTRVSPYVAPPAAERVLPARFASLTVRIALQPWAADKLVIGGLPRSRLPLVLGLFLLTAGLIVAALLQLRREHELANMQTEFVSNVSHELRTPLAQIRMFAETLLLGRVRSPGETHRSLAIIDQEARRLTTLVENVLHFSRAERKAVRIAPEMTLLAPLVREVAESFQPLAAVRNVTLVVNAQELVATVDRGAVQQILVNLLDNAVKYGPPGQTVRIAATLHDGSARLTVEDEGPGILPRERDLIWERFWRPEGERDMAVAGTGIGLSVVRELAELHGGQSWVEARRPTGARFIVELPGARPMEDDIDRGRSATQPRTRTSSEPRDQGTMEADIEPRVSSST
jgi:signal transduction histidine kinase